MIRRVFLLRHVHKKGAVQPVAPQQLLWLWVLWVQLWWVLLPLLWLQLQLLKMSGSLERTRERTGQGTPSA